MTLYVARFFNGHRFLLHRGLRTEKRPVQPLLPAGVKVRYHVPQLVEGLQFFFNFAEHVVLSRGKAEDLETDGSWEVFLKVFALNLQYGTSARLVSEEHKHETLKQNSTGRGLNHLFPRVEVLCFCLRVVDRILDAVDVVGGCFLARGDQARSELYARSDDCAVLHIQNTLLHPQNQP